MKKFFLLSILGISHLFPMNTQNFPILNVILEIPTKVDFKSLQEKGFATLTDDGKIVQDTLEENLLKTLDPDQNGMAKFVGESILLVRNCENPEKLINPLFKALLINQDKTRICSYKTALEIIKKINDPEILKKAFETTFKEDKNNIPFSTKNSIAIINKINDQNFLMHNLEQSLTRKGKEWSEIALAMVQKINDRENLEKFLNIKFENNKKSYFVASDKLQGIYGQCQNNAFIISNEDLLTVYKKSTSSNKLKKCIALHIAHKRPYLNEQISWQDIIEALKEEGVKEFLKNNQEGESGCPIM